MFSVRPRSRDPYYLSWYAHKFHLLQVTDNRWVCLWLRRCISNAVLTVLPWQTVYRALYGSTSCCISHGPCQWERFSTLHSPEAGHIATWTHESFCPILVSTATGRISGHTPTRNTSLRLLAKIVSYGVRKIKFEIWPLYSQKHIIGSQWKFVVVLTVEQ